MKQYAKQIVHSGTGGHQNKAERTVSLRQVDTTPNED